PEAVEDIRKKVLGSKADFGVALDGDADRIGVVDETGAVIWGDMLLLVLARDIIGQWRERGGEDEPPLVISEVKASQVLYDGVERAGGRALMWKTGHSLIKAKMKETGALLAGEMSGHLFFSDRYYGYDDAVYASIRLAEVYVRAVKEGRLERFSDLLRDIPRLSNTPEIRIPCPDESKFRAVEEVTRLLIEHRGTGDEPVIRDVVDVDGVRVIFSNGWGLLRASNTQPVLVMRYEADSDEGLDRYRAFLDGVVQSVIGR
ncbi:MAG: phosphomannomutase, partial [bacterium]